MTAPTLRAQVERVRALEVYYRDQAKAYGSLTNADFPRQSADALAALIGIAEDVIVLRQRTHEQVSMCADCDSVESFVMQLDAILDRRELAGEEP